MGGGSQLCFVLFLIFAVGLAVWGISDIVKRKQPSEASTQETISRQLRGMGILVIAQLVLALGLILCFSMSGGVDSLGRSLKSMMGSTAL